VKNDALRLPLLRQVAVADAGIPLHDQVRRVLRQRRADLLRQLRQIVREFGTLVDAERRQVPAVDAHLLGLRPLQRTGQFGRFLPEVGQPAGLASALRQRCDMFKVYRSIQLRTHVVSTPLSAQA